MPLSYSSSTQVSYRKSDNESDVSSTKICSSGLPAFPSIFSGVLTADIKQAAIQFRTHNESFSLVVEPHGARVSQFRLRSRTVWSRPSWDHSFLLTLSDEDSGVLASSFRSHGVFAPVETKIFSNILQSCDEDCPLVVDVGVNVGYLTFFASAQGCRVVGFEPQRRIHDLLRISATSNNVQGRVAVYPFGLSSNPRRFLQDEPSSWGRARIVDRTTDRKGRKPRTALNEIDVKRLDALIAQPVLLLKIDVEGHELEVLQGAQRLLEQHLVRNIVIEISTQNFQEVWKLLEASYNAFCWAEPYYDDVLIRGIFNTSLRLSSLGRYFSGWRQAFEEKVTDCWFISKWS